MTDGTFSITKAANPTNNICGTRVKEAVPRQVRGEAKHFFSKYVKPSASVKFPRPRGVERSSERMHKRVALLYMNDLQLKSFLVIVTR